MTKQSRKNSERKPPDLRKYHRWYDDKKGGDTLMKDKRAMLVLALSLIIKLLEVVIWICSKI